MGIEVQKSVDMKFKKDCVKNKFVKIIFISKISEIIKMNHGMN